MNDELLFDETEEEEGFEEAGPALIEYEEPVSTEDYAAVIHDSFGERHVNVTMLRERGGVVTILRILGAMELEPKGEVKYFLNGNEVGSGHTVNAGDQIYVVGKLAGGR